MRELKFNLRNLLYKKELYFAILLIFSTNIIHCFMVIKYCDNLDYYYIENMYSAETQFILYNPMVTLNSILIVVYPIICAMLFSDSSFVEKKNKTFNILFTRINTNKNSIIRFALSLIVPFILCFLGFMLNYIIMSLIFKNGLLMSIYQEVGFYQIIDSKYFMDELRYNNPSLYVMAISLVASLIIGLLSCLSYSLANFLKKRIPIYFIPLLIMIMSEFIMSSVHLEKLSIIRFLQPTTQFTLESVLIVCVIMIIIGLVIEIIKKFKKDYIV